MFQSARRVRLSLYRYPLSNGAKICLAPLFISDLAPQPRLKQWRMGSLVSSLTISRHPHENVTFGSQLIRISYSHILPWPSLGSAIETSPQHGYHPLDLQPPSVAHYPSRTHQVKRDSDGHLARLIGSDNTRFFLRMRPRFDWCLEDPRIEIGALFTGTVQSTTVDASNEPLFTGGTLPLEVNSDSYFLVSHDVLYSVLRIGMIIQ